MSRKKANDNVVELFPKDIPHINHETGRVEYNPHALLNPHQTKYISGESRMERIKKSLEKINELMNALK